MPNFPPYAFIENDRLTCDPVDIDAKPLNKQVLRKGGYFHGTGPGEEGWRLEKVMPAITAKAVDYIREQSKGSEPFFLFFSTTSPHTPIVPAKAEFQDTTQAGPYGDYIAQTDEAVGQIVAALKAAGVYQDTLVESSPATTARHPSCGS